MKKLLLVSTAIAGFALWAAPASAAVKLDLGGFFRGYGVFADNDVANERGAEFRRDTEVHVSGETTLDNGLTVGFHTEQKLADSALTTTTDEVYAYASGGWGRVNLGVEDGAAYLLQVGAPSADSNVDGLRATISGLAGNTANGAGSGAGNLFDLDTVFGASSAFSSTKYDYQHADFASTDRLTYLTPKFSGFQAGVSYTPTPDVVDNMTPPGLDTSTGNGLFTDADDGDSAVEYEDLIEVAARWDGEYQGFGLSAGAGYSTADMESPATAVDFTAEGTVLTLGDWYLTDGVDSFNGGLNVNWSGFSLGGNFQRAETSRTTDQSLLLAGPGGVVSGDITRDTWVAGLGWDNGPFHVGASWLNQQTDLDAILLAAADGTNEIGSSEVELTKYTVGAGYTFGPGMTFRGSVAWGEFDTTVAAIVATDADVVDLTTGNNDFQQVAVGADIQF